MEKKSKKIETFTKKENYNFRYEFTPEELKEKSMLLAAACKERNAIEDEKKQVMAEFKAKIDGKNAEVNVIAQHITSGFTYVTNQCTCIMNFGNGIKEYYFNDVLVGQENLSTSDYQLQIDMEVKAKLEKVSD